MVEAKGLARAGRRSWWIGLALVLAYIAWMLGPYLRSVVVRDAAVTMWINVATPFCGISAAIFEMVFLPKIILTGFLNSKLYMIIVFNCSNLRGKVILK